MNIDINFMFIKFSDIKGNSKQISKSKNKKINEIIK